LGAPPPQGGGILPPYSDEWLEIIARTKLSFFSPWGAHKPFYTFTPNNRMGFYPRSLNPFLSTLFSKNLWGPQNKNSGPNISPPPSNKENFLPKIKKFVPPKYF